VIAQILSEILKCRTNDTRRKVRRIWLRVGIPATEILFLYTHTEINNMHSAFNDRTAN